MNWKRILFRAAVVIALAWAGMLALATLHQSRLLYHPDRNLSDLTPGHFGAASHEEVWLDAADGVRLNGWFVHGHPERRKEKTILAFHGNAGNLSTAAPRLALYSGLGYDVFMLDYHGFGKSGGAPGEKNLYLDAGAAWDHLVEARNIAPGDIVILGYSLGGAVAAWLAERRPEAAGLVLESTFTSLADIGSGFFPFLPVHLIVGDAFDTLSRLRRIRLPLLVAHGRGDSLVSFRHGQALFDAYEGDKEFLIIGDDHNWGYLSYEDVYKKGIERFIEGARQENERAGEPLREPVL